MSFIVKSRLVGRIGAVAAVWMASFALVSASGNNSLLNGPVCVDGVNSSKSEWSGSTSATFISGSLYRGIPNSLDDNSETTWAIGQDEDDPKNAPPALFVRIFFRLRTNINFAPGAFVGDVRFPVTIGGVLYPNFVLQLRGAAVGQMGEGPVAAYYDLNGDGLPDGDATALGIKAALGLDVSELALYPVLETELKIPLLIPAHFGSPFPQKGLNGIYGVGSQVWSSVFATDLGMNDQSESIITILPGGVTQWDDKIVPIRVFLDVKPGNNDNNIGSTDTGNLPVAILSTPTLDATRSVLSSLTLGDVRSLQRVPATKSITKDVNGDGLPDLVAFFDLDSNSSALAPDTQVLELNGKLQSGDPISGKQSVTLVH